jgi:hypothetical protein
MEQNSTPAPVQVKMLRLIGYETAPERSKYLTHPTSSVAPEKWEETTIL